MAKKPPLTQAAWIKEQIEDVLLKQGCPKGMMTLGEASRIVGLSVECLARLARSALIPALTFGGVILLDRRAFFAKHAVLKKAGRGQLNQRGLNILATNDESPSADVGAYWATLVGLHSEDHSQRLFQDDFFDDETLPVWLSLQPEVRASNISPLAVWEVVKRWRDFKDFREKVQGIIEIAPSCAMIGRSAA